MGTRIIIGSICASFLFGVIFARSIVIGDDDGWLTFESYIIEMRFGLCSAAIVGLLVCIMEGIIWLTNAWGNKRENASPQVTIKTPVQPPVPPPIPPPIPPRNE